jgi:hypothetical protein
MKVIKSFFEKAIHLVTLAIFGPDCTCANSKQIEAKDYVKTYNDNCCKVKNPHAVSGAFVMPNLTGCICVSGFHPHPHPHPLRNNSNE